MTKEFESYEDAHSAATIGDEIWVRDTRIQPAWRVMTRAEADEYVAKTPFKTHVHWETVKEEIKRILK